MSNDCPDCNHPMERHIGVIEGGKTELTNSKVVKKGEAKNE